MESVCAGNRTGGSNPSLSVRSIMHVGGTHFAGSPCSSLRETRRCPGSNKRSGLPYILSVVSYQESVPAAATRLTSRSYVIEAGSRRPGEVAVEGSIFYSDHG